MDFDLLDGDFFSFRDGLSSVNRDQITSYCQSPGIQREGPPISLDPRLSKFDSVEFDVDLLRIRLG